MSNKTIIFRISILSILLGSIFSTSIAQNSDKQYSMLLSDVLKEVEQHYDITIRDPDHLVEGKILSYALWRFRPDAEETLDNILTPMDLNAQKEGKRKYKIKGYQYHRLSIQEGKEKLEYLSGLYSDIESWEKRKALLKPCIIEALGLNTLPAKPDSQPIIVNKRKMNGYSIENVALETLPGLYVCTSIYKPHKLKSGTPVVLCPNGHFGGGRYRPDQQLRCAAIAKMGGIAVSYDLFAWGESLLQFKPEDHRRSLAMTIQAMNGIRILDYLLSFPETDPERVAVTGGSGGGSQTMLISAIDDRITVSIPVVMLSVIHSGGCPCESGQPVHLCGQGTTNVELASIFAPKPQLVITDGGDWTANVPELEFPFLERIYSFYDMNEMVKNVHFPNEGHDYSHSKRFPMYEFLATQLGLDISKIQNKKGEIDESFITIEKESDMKAFGKSGESLPDNALRSFEELEALIN